MRSLEDVLGKKEPEKAPEQPAAVKEETPATEVEAKSDKPRDDSGKFKKVEAKEETPKVETEVPAETTAAKPAKPETAPNDPETGLKAGITAERKKRQEAERRYQELERKLHEMQQPKAPDALTDPQGYAAHIRSAALDERVNNSVDLAREAFADFDEVMGAGMETWGAAVAKDPTLFERAMTQRNPGKWAYQHMKRAKVLEEVGDDPNAWKEAQKASLRAEIEAELKGKLELEAKNRQPVPSPSLASASSGGRATAPIWSGPKPLNEVLKRR